MSPSCVLYYLIINHRQIGQPVPFWLKPKVFGPSALLTALRFKREWMASQLSPSRGVPAASEPEGQNNGGAGFMDWGPRLRQPPHAGGKDESSRSELISSWQPLRA